MLGLPISRQIVEHFGGWMGIEDHPQGGATFVFELPLDSGAKLAPPASPR